MSEQSMVDLDDLFEVQAGKDKERSEIDELVVSLDELFETPFKPKKKPKSKTVHEWNLPVPYEPKWEAVGITMRVTRQICECGEGHYRQNGLFVHYREERGAEKWSRVTKRELVEARYQTLDHFTEVTEELIDVCMNCFEAGAITVDSNNFDAVVRDLNWGEATDLDNMIGDDE